MQRRDGQLIVSATDLVGFLECGHLTLLDRAGVPSAIVSSSKNAGTVLRFLATLGARVQGDLRLAVEPAAALPLAALQAGVVAPRSEERVLLVVCGANLDLASLRV